MFNRPSLRIPAYAIQRLIQEFTMSHRMWTAYTPDKIEYMMHFYRVLPNDFLYAKFDENTEELVFMGPPEFMLGESIRKDYPLLPTETKLLTG